MNVTNPHLVLRMARFHSDGYDPLKPRREDVAADALLGMENRERYCEQSAHTLDGAAAAVPPRKPLFRFLTPAE